jgi:hypothetical protein
VPIRNERGENVTADTAAQRMAMLVEQYFIVDQNYYEVKYVPGSSSQPGSRNKRLVAHKGQRLSEQAFRTIFGELPGGNMREPTLAEIQQAVDNYLNQNGVTPIEGVKGDPGPAPTQDQLRDVVALYLAENQQIASAVQQYLAMNPPGAIGAVGAGVISANIPANKAADVPVIWDRPMTDPLYFVLAVVEGGDPGVLQVLYPVLRELRGQQSAVVTVKNTGNKAAGAGTVVRALAIRY